MTLRFRLNIIVVALLLGILFFSGVKMSSLWQVIQLDQRLVDTNIILDKIGLGLVDLSLERSVVQVTSALPDPIAPEFRQLLDDQRQKADQAFDLAVKAIEDDHGLKMRDAFLAKFHQQRARLKDLRQKADAILAVPYVERDLAFIQDWPKIMPALIEEIERDRVWMLSQSDSIPSRIMILSDMRHHAWRIREFGGRERTYLAIATALAQPVDKINLEVMQQHLGAVDRSIKMIQLYRSNLILSEPVKQAIENLQDTYFGSYEQLKQRQVNLSHKGIAPDISFTDFFTQSSEALEKSIILYQALLQEGKDYLVKDIHQSYKNLYFNAFLAALLLLIAGYLLWYINFRMFARLAKTQQAIQSLSDKNYDIVLNDIGQKDELGRLSKSVDYFKEQLIAADELKLQQERLKAQAEQDRRAAVVGIAEKFDQKVGGLLKQLTNSVDEVSMLADQMRQASEQTTSISQTTAVAAVETESNVQVVAAATEELSASIAEIASQIEATAQKVSQTASNADQSRDTIKTLSHLAEAIGGVIGSIRDIADQTNLLALNATIEAARAGESGKGFAVVADEVKKLANETALRTDQISDQVTRIQQAVAQSVEAMEGIIVRITEINQAASTVAAAVEEQNAATGEISRNVTQAAAGTKQVSTTIETVKSNAGITGQSAANVLEATRQLQKFANDMNVEVKEFLDQMRA